jgi:hypothetical protein
MAIGHLHASPPEFVVNWQGCPSFQNLSCVLPMPSWVLQSSVQPGIQVRLVVRQRQMRNDLFAREIQADLHLHLHFRS